MVKDIILRDFIRRHLPRYAFGLAALVASGVAQLTLPKLLGRIIDGLEGRSLPPARILGMVFWMLGLSAALFGLKFLWRYLLVGRARDLECHLRDKLFAHLQSLPARFYNQRKTGDLMAYAINDLSAIRQAFAFGLIFPIDGILINSFSLLVMARTIDLRLTTVGFGPLLLAIVLIIRLRRPLRRNFLQVQRSYADISDKTQENISGIRVVKAYVREEAEIEKLTRSSLGRMRAMLDYVRLSALLGPAVDLCFGLSYALVLIVGSRYVVGGRITLGDFIAFNTYLAMLTRPISHIGRVVEVWQRAMASMDRLDEIFLERSESADEKPAADYPGLHGAVTIAGLSFTYPDADREVLHGIDLEIPAGRTLAIIGPTGSGKTTLLNLLLRLYPVERGRIFIDGIDLNDLPLEILRENIGYVPQDSFLFSASIKENIEFFRDIYSGAEVAEAARLSSVYEDIADFPDGFGTIVGERGITLSGGQKQRISIARAIIKNPALLIMDDCLSAVDTGTEEEILANLKELLRGRTGLIVAHRISSIKHADEIAVLADGRIIERGTHEELLAQRGYYYQLYRAQLAENALREAEEATI